VLADGGIPTLVSQPASWSPTLPFFRSVVNFAFSCLHATSPVRVTPGTPGTYQLFFPSHNRVVNPSLWPLFSSRRVGPGHMTFCVDTPLFWWPVARPQPEGHPPHDFKLCSLFTEALACCQVLRCQLGVPVSGDGASQCQRLVRRRREN